MTDRVFDFRTQLRMSEGTVGGTTVPEILLKCFPGAVKVEKANIVDDKNGIDWWVTDQSGNKHGVDVKIQEKDWSKNHPGELDLPLEIWSVINKKVGWTRDLTKRTDYIYWIWKDTGRVVPDMPFPVLRDVFTRNLDNWCKKYWRQVHTQRNNGYESQCIYVPETEVWNAMYKRSRGIFKKCQDKVA